MIGTPLPAGSFLWENAIPMSVVFRSIAATLGGFVTAMLARRHPIVHALVLGGVILLLDLAMASVMPGNQPFWYRPLMSGAGAGFAVLGGCLAVVRHRRRSS